MAERILIVEDEPALQATLAYNLKKDGYIVEVVGNGRTAVEAARRLKPDLIVLDLMLPELDVKFSGYCAIENGHVVVDLANVDFLASIGIQLLVANAKSLSRRAGRMILLCPKPDVRRVLEIAGIPAVIPMYDSLEFGGGCLPRLVENGCAEPEISHLQFC